MFTTQQFLDYHKKFCDDIFELCRKKNSDYTSLSPFDNFNMCEQRGVATSEAGVWIRMSDKMSRIASYLSKGALLVNDESVEDTLKDIANYAIIMSAILKEKKESQSASKV